MRLIKAVLFGTVFTTGAAVLVIEVAAVRLLSPYFGASLYVLSSVLTVILLALSLGYYLGGKCSDRLSYALPLYFIITTGGLTLLGLLVLGDSILPTVAPTTPMIVGPIFFSTLLFFTPAFLLGIDSPYVIKLLSQAVPDSEQGGIVGSTFFWSTAGSITGSLLSGFWFIPSFGLRETLVATGVVLVLLGIGGGLIVRAVWRTRTDYDERNDIHLAIPIAVALLLCLILAYVSSTKYAEASSLYSADGYYSHLRIHDSTLNKRPVRYLRREVNGSSAIYLDGTDMVFAYTKYAAFYKHLVPDATSFLMLGGGAYTIPAAMHRLDPELLIDVVELEPSLYPLAQEYFNLPKTDMIRNHVMDARVFVNRATSTYDVIFLDVFSSGHFVPPHLVTKEFFHVLHTRLSEDGVIIINFIGAPLARGERSLLGSFTKTVRSIFPSVYTYVTYPQHLEFPQNVMFVLQKSADAHSLPDDLIVTQNTQSHTLAELLRDPDSFVGPLDIAYTDNHNPVELLILQDRFRYE